MGGIILLDLSNIDENSVAFNFGGDVGTEADVDDDDADDVVKSKETETETEL